MRLGHYENSTQMHSDEGAVWYLLVDSFSGRSGDKRTREWHSVGQEAGLWRALISCPLLTEVRERNSFTPSERQQVGQRVMGVKGRGRRKKGREKDRKVVRAFAVQPSERLCLSQPPQPLWPSYRAIMEMFLWSRVLHFFPPPPKEVSREVSIPLSSPLPGHGSVSPCICSPFSIVWKKGCLGECDLNGATEL